MTISCIPVNLITLSKGWHRKNLKNRTGSLACNCGKESEGHILGLIEEANTHEEETNGAHAITIIEAICRMGLIEQDI